MTPWQASLHTCQRVGDLYPLINAPLLRGISSSFFVLVHLPIIFLFLGQFFYIFSLGAFSLCRLEPLKGPFDAFSMSATLIQLRRSALHPGASSAN